MQFEFILQSLWPPLSWLARCDRCSPTIEIFHGPRVEVTDQWYIEGVWAGDYQSGDFDLTDIVAGSGGRLRDGVAKFVSSGSTVDRLQSIQVGETVWVSNSLACLTAAVGACLDPTYPWYVRDASTVIHGLDKYKRTLSTSVGDIQLTYFDNLVWNGAALQVESKPGALRDFSSFARYEVFLQMSMSGIAANMGARERRFRLRMIASMSSGYDSTAVTVLAKQHGLTEVITFDRAQRGDEDSGETAAKVLDLKVHKIGLEAWRRKVFVEVPFVGSYSSAEDIAFQGMESQLSDRVFLTGFHGDKMWDPATKVLSDQIARGDPSGLALTEYRLWVGFINCPVPFWGVRQIRDVNTISKSEDMRPWNVPGDYNRPIPRRIAEQAGIPRHAFGIRKRAASLNMYGMAGKHNILTPASMDDYLDWIKQNRSAWSKRGRIPPIASANLNYVINRAYMACIDLRNSVNSVPYLWRLGSREYEPKYLNGYLFPWALNRAARRYPWTILRK